MISIIYSTLSLLYGGTFIQYIVVIYNSVSILSNKPNGCKIESGCDHDLQKYELDISARQEFHKRSDICWSKQMGSTANVYVKSMDGTETMRRVIVSNRPPGRL